MTIEQLSTLYVTNHLVRRSSFDTTKRLLRNTFGRLERFSVDELTPQTVLEWHTSLSGTPYQANRALGVLRSMIRWGIRLQLCKIDPTSGVRRFPVSSRSRFMNTEEIGRLLKSLETAAENIRMFVLIVLSTGCRRSEARNIKWSDVDLAHRRWTKPRTKNGQWHVVPLPNQIITALRLYPQDGPWMFTGQDGRPWSVAGIEKAWGKVRKNCNLTDVRIHDLRRTAASHMAINGENLSTIQKMLDHSSLQATAVYARLNLDALDGALQRNADRFFTDSTKARC
jgi:integrase